MARSRNVENPVRAATQRKWYARAWWAGVHVYGYVVLGYKDALSPNAMSTAEFVLCLVVAAVTIGCYVVLQLSSPGQLEKRPLLAPVPMQSSGSESFSSPQLTPGDDDDDELLASTGSVDLHFCDECHVFQPLRTKHCKDCARCTRQYDHHCDCVGTCVGESNRRLFVLYLALQILEGAVMISVTSAAFTEGDDLNDWFKTNALFIVLWFMLMCVLLISVSLFCYQAFLISTNQCSMSSAVAINAALLAVSVALSSGALLLLLWIRAPIAEARKLAKEVDPAQEDSFEDPNALDDKTKLRTFGSLGDDTAGVSLTVVMPAYNEEQRILVTIKDTVAFLEDKKRKDPSFSYEILVVDDCSVDKTVDVVMQEVKTHSVDKIRLLKLQKNHGKGGAIRKGVMRARGERILFADADNATEIRDYDKLALAMDQVHESGKTGVVVCGSRAHLEEQAIAKRNPLRNLLMHGFHLIVSTLCIKNVRDTQCGFKLFDRTAARVLFPPMHIERWAFDVELLYLAASTKMTIKEVAVQWTEVPGSKLSVISASLSMLREIVLIRLCYTLGVWQISDGGFRLARRQPVQ
ncbi:dolichyl-phosphate beta-glucosyltransferase [Phytophthora boehmeriae]|uniref:Palmitoyltransferase n=1 Tax=Phytophthora boehmeriae TaxID=109152 RepID=A0A8T1X836_9STRA|nr:dolichyl-phosphate beta-glucosyltransferase [Phytophthora boehmeriae]